MKKVKIASIHQHISRVSKVPEPGLFVRCLQLKFFSVILFLHVFGAYIICCLKENKLAKTD